MGGEVCYPCRWGAWPNLLHATAAEADLSTFSLALKAWTLSYNLSRRKVRLVLHYHAVAADAYCQDQRFAHARLPDFSQLVGGMAAAAFRREDTEGTFSIHVMLLANTEIQAQAQAPAMHPRPSSSSTPATACHVSY